MSKFTYTQDIEQIKRIKMITELLEEGVNTRSSLEDHNDDWKYDPQVRGCLLEIHGLIEEFMVSEDMGKLTTLGDGS